MNPPAVDEKHGKLSSSSGNGERLRFGRFGLFVDGSGVLADALLKQVGAAAKRKEIKII